MAITIVQEPASFFNPAFNDIIFELESDNVSQPNFAYLFDVYVRGDLVKRFAVKAEPVNNHGFFFANRILESYISTHVVDPASTDAFFNCSGSYADFEIKYGERYGATGSVTDYADLDSSTGYIFNGAFAARDLMDGEAVTLTSSTRYALKKQITYTMYRNQYDFMYYLCELSPAIEKMVVETLDIDENTIDKHEFTNPSPGQAGMFMVPCGYNMNNVDSSFHTMGSSPVLDDAVKSMRIWFEDTGGTTRSRTYHVSINDECSPYTQYDLWWTNRLGGKDSYRFRRIHDESLDPIVKEQYKKTPYTMVEGEQLTLSTTNEAFKTYFGSSQESILLRSDWMTDEEAERMRDLHTSNDVVLWDGTSQWQVLVQANVYDKKKTTTGQLIQYEIKVKFAYLNYSQR